MLPGAPRNKISLVGRRITWRLVRATFIVCNGTLPERKSTSRLAENRVVWAPAACSRGMGDRYSVGNLYEPFYKLADRSCKSSPQIASRKALPQLPGLIFAVWRCIRRSGTGLQGRAKPAIKA